MIWRYMNISILRVIASVCGKMTLGGPSRGAPFTTIWLNAFSRGRPATTACTISHRVSVIIISTAATASASWRQMNPAYRGVDAGYHSAPTYHQIASYGIQPWLATTGTRIRESTTENIVLYIKRIEIPIFDHKNKSCHGKLPTVPDTVNTGVTARFARAVHTENNAYLLV